VKGDMKKIVDVVTDDKEGGPGREENVPVCNGESVQVNGADSDGDCCLEEDEDIKNISVPELIEKFENMDHGDTDSDQEHTGEYCLQEGESREILYIVENQAEKLRNNKEEKSELIGGEISDQMGKVDKVIDDTVKDLVNDAIGIENELASNPPRVIRQNTYTISEIDNSNQKVIYTDDTVMEIQENACSNSEMITSEDVNTCQKSTISCLSEDMMNTTLEQNISSQTSQESTCTVSQVSSSVQKVSLLSQMSHKITEKSSAVSEMTSSIREMTEENTSIESSQEVTTQNKEWSVSKMETSSQEVVTAQKSSSVSEVTVYTQEVTSVEEKVTSSDIEVTVPPQTVIPLVDKVTTSDIEVTMSQQEIIPEEEILPISDSEVTISPHQVIPEEEKVTTSDINVTISPQEVIPVEDKLTTSELEVITSPQEVTPVDDKVTTVVDPSGTDSLEENKFKHIDEIARHLLTEIVTPCLTSYQPSNSDKTDICEEPIYKDADGENFEEVDYTKNSAAKMENKYVTAEEVRIQKQKKITTSNFTTSSTSSSTTDSEVSSATTTVTVTEKDSVTNPEEVEPDETKMEEGNPKEMEHYSKEMMTAASAMALPLILPTMNMAKDKEEVEKLEHTLTTDPELLMSDDERRSKDVDQLLEDIQDPELDSSLEDIAAMVEGRTPIPSTDNKRGSPEFTQAAGLIDQNLDKGFDPEDPAVKEIEDWECTNNMDGVEESLENIRTKSRTLKNSVFKRLSKAEERKSLIDTNSLGRGGEEMEKEKDESSCGCFNSWLVYIFLKIFD